MVTTRQKQGAGVVAAALLLLGSAYAWQSADQHKTNELRDTFKDNDVTLVEDFVPITNWLQGQEVNKDISVKNNTSAETGNNAYVRIQLKEFLEFTDKTEERSTVRYAVNTEGNFAKFETEDEAKTYAAANNLTGNPVQIEETAFEGENYWFIPTNADATNGQYGKFLVLKVGDGTSKSIIDESVSKATNIDHQAIKHAEDDYTTQFFNSGDDKLRTYPSLVKNYPTGGGIAADKDLKDYISWTFGPDVTTLDDFDAETATAAQWVIDPATGWVYWSQALAPGQTTGKFLDSLTLTLAPKNVSLYYAIHTDLEAVDYNEITTMDSIAKIPDEILATWGNQKFTVTFDSKGGSTTPESQKVEAGAKITPPVAPTKEGFEFAGWYAKADLTGNAWNFETDIMPNDAMTLYAKWTVGNYQVTFHNNSAETADTQISVDYDSLFSAPSPAPTLTGWELVGWFEDSEFEGTAWDFAADKMPSGNLDLYAKWTRASFDVVYMDGNTTYKTESQPYGLPFTAPTAPTKLGFEFNGWFTEETLTTEWDFDGMTMPAETMTLYAKWEVEIPALDVENTNAGSEFTFLGANWRILKTDMDNDDSNGYQALVIRMSPLSKREAGIAADDSSARPTFRDGEPYFSANGANGYDAGASNPNYVKGAIDNYYTTKIKGTPAEAYVNAVNLHNPIYDDFKSGLAFSGNAYNAWSWSDFYKDTRFKTTLDEEGSKQAFALSFGDVYTIAGVNVGDTTISKLTFSTNKTFWLRSAGGLYRDAGYVNNGAINAGTHLGNSIIDVRPSLSLTIK